MIKLGREHLQIIWIIRKEFNKKWKSGGSEYFNKVVGNNADKMVCVSRPVFKENKENKK